MFAGFSGGGQAAGPIEQQRLERHGAARAAVSSLMA